MATYTPTASAQKNLDKNLVDIKNRFDAATNKAYQTSENNMYSGISANQTVALDTIRKANAKAIATGASTGMQAANELSATLKQQKQGTDAISSLYEKKASDLAGNATGAQTAANALYSADTQYDVGQMDYYARLDAALKTLEGTRYNADQNLAAAQTQAAATRAAASMAAAGSRDYGLSAAQLASTGSKTLDSTLNMAIKTGNSIEYVNAMIANGLASNYDDAMKLYNGNRAAYEASVQKNSTAAGQMAAGVQTAGQVAGYPKEGETRIKDGVLYLFKEDQWIRQN